MIKRLANQQTPNTKHQTLNNYLIVPSIISMIFLMALYIRDSPHSLHDSVPDGAIYICDSFLDGTIYICDGIDSVDSVHDIILDSTIYIRDGVDSVHVIVHSLNDSAPDGTILLKYNI